MTCAATACVGTALAMPTHTMHHPLKTRKDHITILNTSAHHHPLKVTYRVVWQNPGQKPMLSKPRTFMLHDAKQIPVNFHQHKYVGVVPTRLNGHKLPMKVTMPAGAKNRCSVLISHQHPHASLMLTMSEHPHARKHHRHTLTCSKVGGVVA